MTYKNVLVGLGSLEKPSKGRTGIGKYVCECPGYGEFNDLIVAGRCCLKLLLCIMCNGISSTIHLC